MPGPGAGAADGGGTAREGGAGKGVVLGTGGHVDHGKTSLVRALTGVDTDRWSEEKRRGLTIDLGFARLPLGDGLEVGVVDVPGHEDFLKNMLAGATGIDLLLLAVAADEGPMPQTVEHLAIARLLGVRRGVVALTKVDRVEEEWRELAAEATREEVARLMGEPWPLVPVSSVTGEGLDALREALRSAASDAPGRAGPDLFRLPVDRSFSVHGTGTVVTGTVWSGAVRSGDAVRALPLDRACRVRGLQVHGAGRASVTAGRRCAVALVGVAPEDVPRGSVVVGGGPWRPTRRIGVRLRLLAHPGRAVEHGQRVRVYLGTAEAMARAYPSARSTLGPGERGWALLRLEAPLVARAGDRFVLRFYSPVTTIGGGRVAEVDAPRRWEGREAVWERVLDGPPRDRIRAAVELAGRGGAPEETLPLRTGLAPGRVAEVTGDPPPGLVRLGGRWFDGRRLDEARAHLLADLEAMHRRRPRASSASREALRARAGERFAPELVEEALRSLAASGEILASGPAVRRAGHEARLTEEEARVGRALLERLEAAGPEPPPVEELERRLSLDRDLLNDLLQLYQEEGRLVALTPELYVSAATAEALEAGARRVLEREPLASPGSFKAAFGVTRRYLIPILEHLDSRGVTRRTGEGRTLAGNPSAEEGE